MEERPLEEYFKNDPRVPPQLEKSNWQYYKEITLEDLEKYLVQMAIGRELTQEEINKLREYGK